jgi:transcriptional regulator with XRE-family HTH domain
LALISGRQLKAARALIGWEQTDLAKKSGVAISTVRRMESFDGEIGARTATLSLVQRALEKAGVDFLNHERPGVRMRAKGVKFSSELRMTGCEIKGQVRYARLRIAVGTQRLGKAHPASAEAALRTAGRHLPAHRR